MEIYLGNIEFNQVKDKFGYQLTEEDKSIWDKYHNDLADLSGMESSFHLFDIPRCIKFKGEEAKNAILKMFTGDKLVNPIGRFHVYEQK